MAKEAPDISKKLSSLKQTAPELQKAAAVGAAIVVPILIFVFVIAARLPNAGQGAVPAGVSGDAVLMYTEKLPFRTQPSTSVDVIYNMPLPSDPQTGKQKNAGYLTGNDLGGVRINPDGTTWIIVVLRDEIVYQEYYSGDEDIREEFYVPATHFRFAPGARKPSFLKNIDL
jgi:hypothetical protein